MKHMNEEELYAYREGEMKQRETIAAHLQQCGECRAELERIDLVFQALNAIPVPDPGEDYGSKVWRQIENRLPEKRASWWSAWFAPRRMLAMGAAAALLVAAVLSGHYLWPRDILTGMFPTPAKSAGAFSSSPSAIISASRDGFNGTRQPPTTESGKKLINISMEQKRAEDLVEENRLYRQTAVSDGDNAMAHTLDELERVLLDVANSPAEVTPAQFESIQKRIAAQGILLKVRVVRQELRTEARERSTAPAQNDSTAKARNKV
jgi:hypothetical protein